MTAPRRPSQPIPAAKAPAMLRQRQRADGSWRIWWEPRTDHRALGFAVVELDERRPTWSIREAERLNKELAEAQETGRRPMRAAGSRSVEALIDAYRKSRHWRSLAPKTQDSYSKVFRLLAVKWGPHQVADFSKPAMDAWYEALLETRGEWTASSRLRHMSLLMSYAETIGWRGQNSNPCSRLKLVTPRGRRRVAGWAELDALTTAAEGAGMASLALMIRLSLFQGQRETDVMAATAGAFTRMPVQLDGWPAPRDVWVWQLVRSKRGNAGAMVLHDEVAPHLERAIAAATARVRARAPDLTGPALAAALAAEPLVIDEMSGRPYNEDRFQSRWRKARSLAAEAAAKAGAEDLGDLGTLQFRDLRRTFGNRSRAGGASKDDTADVLGNSAATDQQLGDIYMAPQFETASRAVMAVRRPEAKSERKKA